MKKIIDTLVMLLVSIVLPLMFKPHLLLTWPIWVVMAAGLFLGLSQPALVKQEKQTNIHDKFSMVLIVLGVLFCFVFSVIEFAYFSNQEIQFNQGYVLVGIGLIIFGFSFRYYSIRILGNFFTSEVRIQENHELIKVGPYKYLRHPSYLGAWLGVLGVAVFLQSKWGVAVAVFIYFPTYIYRIHCEEEALSEKFPAKYPEYQKETWKMFPYLF